MQLPRLNELIAAFSRLRVAVVGDFSLDKLLHLDPTLVERSENSGRMVHQVVGIRTSPSAAGTVVNNLASLGASDLHVFGVIGDDGEGYELCQNLRRLRCTTEGLLRFPDFRTPAVIRPLDLSSDGWTGRHPRYDIHNRVPIPDEAIERLTKNLQEILPVVDAVIVMDQADHPDTGVIAPQLRDELSRLALAYPKVFFWADSRRNARHFRNIIIKPNEFEAVGRFRPIAGDEVRLTDLKAVLPRLRAETGAPVFITFGEKGILVSDPKGQLVPGIHLQGLLDPTGAGDTATAGMVLASAAGATSIETALIGNLVAAATIKQIGTAGIAAPEQLRDGLQQWQEQNPRGAVDLDQLQDLTDIDMN
jgi:bifunctional ADP-heptose synthase (sugar kinase/adenylyltransferase)